MSANNLKKGLSRRHILFIALGSAIGAGLFKGSGDAINLAGPGVLLAYCIAGAVAFLVMRSLGEMALQYPISGSFGRYAASFISPLAGFITGWTYVFEMALVCLVDITAFAAYMGVWYPGVSPWIWTLGITLIICGINFLHVKVFGELEFWLSIIKVSAIIIIIILGAGIIFFGFWTHDGQATGISNLWTNDGWLPHGWFGLIASFTVVLFAFGGIEIIGLTAAEAQDADKNLPKAINAIPIRIVIFYVLSLAVLMSIYPWNAIPEGQSPFTAIFTGLGFPYVADIINIVIITAVVSAINSDLYGAGRMMHGLAEDGQALKHLRYTSPSGVPTITILLMLGVLIIGVILNYFFPDDIFFIFLAMGAFATVLVWLMILLSQVMMRFKSTKEEIKALKFPVPFWPVGPFLAILFMFFIFGLIAYFEDTRFIIYVGLAWLAWLVVCYYAIKHLDKEGRFVLKKKD
ncbi:amino acid permease (plasmid) [Bartonella sp. HY329]|uniref:amino acid permease n=1 Tax=unclassified Bartonella TaxID=2645622 RepID=UPI0021C89DB3|nr:MULTISPECIES: amino acid permease [unclassified Bartonella]UXM96513.1 amino acid permease [Bartonella sp. HY329]UXN10836.1 amino acid permease [Bartonella sp. HY328]